MPYVPNSTRKKCLETGIASSPGELNFLFTVEFIKYWRSSGERYNAIHDIQKHIEAIRLSVIANNEHGIRDLSRSLVNIYKNSTLEYTEDLLAALSLAMFEFYSRVAEPYEKQKAYENGDVYNEEYNE